LKQHGSLGILPAVPRISSSNTGRCDWKPRGRDVCLLRSPRAERARRKGWCKRQMECQTLGDMDMVHKSISGHNWTSSSIVQSACVVPFGSC
jgi:hypothetical protein